MVGRASPKSLPIRLLTSPHDAIISNRWRSPQANFNTRCDGTRFAVQNDYHQDSRKCDEGYRRIELISGTSRRRRWSDEERARILTESFAPGANISAVARRHGVSGGLLHCWRKQARALASEEAAADTPTFVPIAIADESSSQRSIATAVRAKDGSAPPERMIEIETSGALVRVPTGADSKTLSIVLAALRRAP